MDPCNEDHYDVVVKYKEEATASMQYLRYPIKIADFRDAKALDTFMQGVSYDVNNTVRYLLPMVRSLQAISNGASLVIDYDATTLDLRVKKRKAARSFSMPLRHLIAEYASGDMHRLAPVVQFMQSAKTKGKKAKKLEAENVMPSKGSRPDAPIKKRGAA